MKKVIFAVSLLAYCLLVAISGKAQQGIDVPREVKESFAKNFRNSEFERWMQIQDSYVATFKENNVWRDAYFTEDGEYKGTGKYITLDFLPIAVQKSLSDKYSVFEISELYQYEGSETGLSFYAVLRNAKNELILQFSSYGDITFSKKNKIREGNPTMSDIAVNKNN